MKALKIFNSKIGIFAMYDMVIRDKSKYRFNVFLFD
jgi:hypothetical protein